MPINRGIEQYYDTEFKYIPVEKETSCYVKDLEGNEYFLDAITTNENEANGNQVLSATIEANKVNSIFINDISEMWNVIDHDTVEHKIIYAKKQGKGNKSFVQIKAIPLFFDVLKNQRIYERIDKHMTAVEAFTLIFNGTGFSFVLVDSFLAVDWEGFGDGEEKIESFKRALERYKAEFKIVGATVYLQTLIGRDADIMYRYKLNASNIVKEIDANNLWTYARGYGDYGDGEGGEDWQNHKLFREYTSPLANILGIKHAPPIKNGNIKDKNFMDKQLKTLVDESLKISVSATIHDLRKQGYPIAQSEVGDRVFLIDERIGLNEEIRVVYQSITRDSKGNILDINLNFGSEGLSKRHQSKINTGIKRIEEILEGRIQLPYNALDEAVRLATEALKSAQTELQFENGIISIAKDNPNHLTILNSNGFGVSRDGGNTFEDAITYLGINTKLLTAGDIHTNNIRIIGDSNYFFWDGTGLHAIDPNDLNRFIRIRSDGMYIAKGALTVERPDGFRTIIDGYANQNFGVFSAYPPFTSSAVTIENQWCTTSHFSNPVDMNYYSFRREGRYLIVHLAYHREILSGSGTGAIYVVRSGGGVLLSKVFDNSSGSNEAVYGETFRIDLGIPDGQQYAFYIQLKAGNAGVKAYGRIMRIWQEG